MKDIAFSPLKNLPLQILVGLRGTFFQFARHLGNLCIMFKALISKLGQSEEARTEEREALNAKFELLCFSHSCQLEIKHKKQMIAGY